LEDGADTGDKHQASNLAEIGLVAHGPNGWLDGRHDGSFFL
jgi:hypothetical protein